MGLAGAHVCNCYVRRVILDVLDMSINTDAAWLSSKDVLALVVARTGSVEEAERLLAKWAIERGFQCRSSVSTEELDFGRLSAHPPTEINTRILAIHRSRPDQYESIEKPFWKTRGTSIHEDRLWQWDKGVFAIVGPVPAVMRHDPKTSRAYITPARRYVSYDVEFQQLEIEEFLRTLPKPRTLRAPRVASTAKFPDELILEQFDHWIASGEMERRFGGVNQHGAQARIRKHLIHELASWRHGGWVEPSESTAKRRAKKIWDRWRAARAA